MASGVVRIVLAMALAIVVLPMTAHMQEEAARPDELSPASRHAQVIAHGVTEMPASDVAWRVGVQRAAPPNRSVSEAPDAGFVLADDGPIAIGDERGNVLARLAPGEAVWTAPGEVRAVFSANARGGDYYEIALTAASARGEGEIVGEPFASPEGVAFDVDLIRDVLARGEENVIAPGAAPLLLLVTGGSVFVDLGNGEIAEMAAGERALIAGEVVISGASRGPASFVVARIGAEQRTPVRLLEALATPSGSPVASPMAGATPVAGGGATLRVAAFVCGPVDDERSGASECVTPAAGLPFAVAQEGQEPRQRPASANGQADFADLAPGAAALSVSLPGGAVTENVSCRNVFGDETALASGGDSVRLTLEPGDDVACEWTIAPDTGSNAIGSSLSVAIRACPVGMTLDRLAAAACELAPPGVSLTLRARGNEAPLGVARALPESWAWDGLEQGAYTLDVNAIPEGLAAYALDDEPASEDPGERDFTIRIPAGFVIRERTLYLFPPDVPRTLSLAVDLRACPQGMAAETLVAELCGPAPPGTRLTLSERGAAIEPFSALDDAWVWIELGPLDYELQVDTLPEGATGAQLDDEPSGREDATFTLPLSEALPEARHMIFLWQPFIDADESDADGDGLVDAVETSLGTHPFLIDSDEDGLNDRDEVDFFGSDPLVPDTDDDGLTDAEEVLTHFTNPFLADSDGDGVTDAREIAVASNPLDPVSLPETPAPSPTPIRTPTATLGLTATPLPLATAPATATRQPAALPTVAPAMTASPAALSAATPLAPDPEIAPEDALDGDGLATIDEVAIYGTNPTVADSDGDGANDGDEVAAGTDPLDPDDR